MFSRNVPGDARTLMMDAGRNKAAITMQKPTGNAKIAAGRSATIDDIKNHNLNGIRYVLCMTFSPDMKYGTSETTPLLGSSPDVCSVCICSEAVLFSSFGLILFP